ncbi:hypothetical protein R5W23_002302 [Gemmata sp. JC673]|uniref:Lipoprotein SmpA/OmlA domain-containing protein n=1 Tax=Gemmata algarum TaxID=2975278 RepID=A0ABU5F4C4_9BACT|nr:hypothetical protein [Gemmata algarum]MDY3561043.1 hypothetical protein [Gemmata algarum]
MRRVYPVLALLMPLNGCAFLVATSGKDVGALATRDEVQHDFGTPVVSGSVEGQPYDEFRTHRKISEGWKSIYYSMGYVVTLGFGEVIWLPNELYRATRRSIVGQTVRFVYDEAGNVKSVQLDGEAIPNAPRPR